MQSLTCDQFDTQLDQLNHQLRDRQISFSEWMKLNISLYRAHPGCSHYELKKTRSLIASQLNLESED